MLGELVKAIGLNVSAPPKKKKLVALPHAHAIMVCHSACTQTKIVHKYPRLKSEKTPSLAHVLKQTSFNFPFCFLAFSLLCPAFPFRLSSFRPLFFLPPFFLLV